MNNTTITLYIENSNVREAHHQVAAFTAACRGAFKKKASGISSAPRPPLAHPVCCFKKNTQQNTTKSNNKSL